MTETFGEEWETYDEALSGIFSLGRGDRLPMFIEWWASVDGSPLDLDDVRRLFAEVWMDTESAYGWRDEVLEMLQWIARKSPVTDADLNLTGEATIYRGTSGRGDETGISWTLSLDKARWFARRFAILDSTGLGRVYRATVQASDVLAYLTGRNEEEIIVDPTMLKDVQLVETPLGRDADTPDAH
jgi:hypothetical protein